MVKVKPTRLLAKKVKIEEKMSGMSKFTHRKYSCIYINLPRKIAKSRKWEKGEELILIPMEEVLELRDGDVVIRRNPNGKKNGEG